jgi:hypothetical protein
VAAGTDGGRHLDAGPVEEGDPGEAGDADGLPEPLEGTLRKGP